MTTASTVEAGKAVALQTFAALNGRGQKWRNRNVPIYIREQLWCAYYLREEAGETLLYTIRPPDSQHPKVYFARWPPDGHETAI